MQHKKVPEGFLNDVQETFDVFVEVDSEPFQSRMCITCSMLLNLVA